MFKTTAAHRKYWQKRKIDWEQSYLMGVDERTGQPMWNHPHRTIIIQALKSFRWVSLWEVGCGGGANLLKIIKEFKGKQLGGSDVNADAIKLCEKLFVGAKFQNESVENIMLSDSAVDVVLADATLLYVGPAKIRQALGEMVRIGRNQIVLCELHGGNWLTRWWLRFKTGYNAYDYRRELEELGCFDIQIVKIPKDYWPGSPWEQWGHIIVARLPDSTVKRTHS